MRASLTFGVGVGVALLALTGCSTEPRQEHSGTIGARAAQYALEMKGKPYRYGGNTPRGFDCSGLVQYSYARAGARVPRSTEGLLDSSSPISSHGLQPGDLLFFNQQGKHASHVAIYIGRGRFVHAPSRGKHVSVGSIRDGYWRRYLTSMRRLDLY